MSLASPSVSTLMLDMKVDAYGSRLNFFSASKAVVARKKLPPQFCPLTQFLPTHCDNGCLSVTNTRVTLHWFTHVP